MSKFSRLVTVLLVQLICVQLCTLLPTVAEEEGEVVKLAVATKPVCGQRRITNRNPKIVNGTNAFHGQFPWAVSIKAKSKHHCGGALLNHQWVLTAAHCVYRKSPTIFTLKMGGHIKLAEKEPNSIEVSAKQMFAHSGFSFSNFRDDIALIKLDRRVNYTDYISPVCLPSAKYYTQGDNNNTTMPNATVIGWGRLQSGGGSAEKLQLLELPIIDNKRCIAWYKTQGRTLSLKSGQFCAGFEEGGKDACQGDSGGPLMIEDAETNTTEVFGIVSAGIGCALPKLPGLYTKVAAYVQWITTIMNTWSEPTEQNDSTVKPAIIIKKIVNATNLDHNPIVITNNHKKLNLTKIGQTSNIKPAVIDNSIIQNRVQQ